MKTLSGACYLVCKKRKYGNLQVRLTSKPPALDAEEVAIKLDVRLPETLFTRPALHASVSIPDGVVPGPTINTTVVDNIRQIVSQQLGVDLRIAVVEPTTAAPKHEYVDCPAGTGCSDCNASSATGDA